jgi:hypothetical protein
VRRAEADKGRDEDDSAGVGDAGGEGFDVGGGADELEVVAQPLDDRAADEDAALESVLETLVSAGGEGGDEAVPGAGKAGADVLEEKTAGTVGVFGLPALQQSWPKSAACWSPAMPAI